ncbi:hypothetical protein V8D89_005461 [Ganoderma adspersum]
MTRDDLPKSSATAHEDTTAVASYLYDASKREFEVSYDMPEIAKLTVQRRRRPPLDCKRLLA